MSITGRTDKYIVIYLYGCTFLHHNLKNVKYLGYLSFSFNKMPQSYEQCQAGKRRVHSVQFHLHPVQEQAKLSAIEVRIVVSLPSEA